MISQIEFYSNCKRTSRTQTQTIQSMPIVCCKLKIWWMFWPNMAHKYHIFFFFCTTNITHSKTNNLIRHLNLAAFFDEIICNKLFEWKKKISSIISNYSNLTLPRNHGMNTGIASRGGGRLHPQGMNTILCNYDYIADRSVITVARQHHTRSHACSFALSVVANVFAFLLALMETSKTALVTTIGRPKKAVQNVLNFFFISK
ncbi:hypothetical protein YC2023_013548 [Brassica napus]